MIERADEFLTTNETGSNGALEDKSRLAEWAKPICAVNHSFLLHEPSIIPLLRHYHKRNRFATSVRPALYNVIRYWRLLPGKMPITAINNLKSMPREKQEEIIEDISRRMNHKEWSMFKAGYLLPNGVKAARSIMVEKETEPHRFGRQDPIGDRPEYFSWILDGCANDEDRHKIYSYVEGLQRARTTVQMRYDDYDNPVIGKPDEDNLIMIDAARSKDQVQHPAPVGPNMRRLTRRKREHLKAEGKNDPHGLVWSVKSETFRAEVKAIIKRARKLHPELPRTITPGKLRTYGANVMISKGANPLHVLTMMGHKTKLTSASDHYIGSKLRELLDTYTKFKPTPDPDKTIQEAQEILQAGGVKLDLKEHLRGTPSLSAPSPQPSPESSSEKWLYSQVSQAVKPYLNDPTFKIEWQGSYMRGLSDTCEVFSLKVVKPFDEKIVSRGGLTTIRYPAFEGRIHANTASQGMYSPTGERWGAAVSLPFPLLSRELMNDELRGFIP